MAKSIKLSNDIYIDSSAIINKISANERTTLDNILGNWGNSAAVGDYTGDLNSLLKTGWVVTGSSNSNRPPTVGDGCWYVLTFVKNPTYYVKQIAFSRSTNDIYQRMRGGSSTWTSWTKII